MIRIKVDINEFCSWQFQFHIVLIKKLMKCNYIISPVARLHNKHVLSSHRLSNVDMCLVAWVLGDYILTQLHVHTSRKHMYMVQQRASLRVEKCHDLHTLQQPRQDRDKSFPPARRTLWHAWRPLVCDRIFQMQRDDQALWMPCT